MGIPIKNIFITELSFQRAPEVSTPLKYSFKVQIGSSVDEDKKTAQVNLKLELSETTRKEVTLTCCRIGLFDITEKDEMPISLDEFLSINAPALVFPYLRETVTNITLHSGINPIFIPTINFKEIRDKKQEEAPDKSKE
jgi:preprotein translocase subunit SecB